MSVSLKTTKNHNGDCLGLHFKSSAALKEGSIVLWLVSYQLQLGTSLLALWLKSQAVEWCLHSLWWASAWVGRSRALALPAAQRCYKDRCIFWAFGKITVSSLPPFTPFFKDSNLVIAKKRSKANLGHLFNHESILNFKEICRIF